MMTSYRSYLVVVVGAVVVSKREMVYLGLGVVVVVVVEL